MSAPATELFPAIHAADEQQVQPFGASQEAPGFVVPVTEEYVAAIRGLSSAVLKGKQYRELQLGDGPEILVRGFTHATAQRTDLLRESYEVNSNPDTTPPSKIELITHAPTDVEGKSDATYYSLESDQLMAHRRTDMDSTELWEFMGKVLKRGGNIVREEGDLQHAEGFYRALARLAGGNDINSPL